MLLAACSPGRPRALAGPTDDVRIPWDPGTYHVRGVVEYRDDSATAQRTRRITALAELVVGPQGPVGLSTQAGLCRLQPRVEAHEGYRYDCQGAIYSFFRSQRLAGTVSLDVTESRLGPRTCVEYGQSAMGQRICVRYEQALVSQMRSVTSRLHFDRMGG
jgi:hypothetical protein